MKLILNLICLAMTMNLIGQNTIYDFKFNTIAGEEKSFVEFKGKKILIVNTASECGYTSQYSELQEMHEHYAGKLVIIGFPANNFGRQEPKANKEIALFCKKNYGVTFLMAEKISVKGSDIHPIFEWLIHQENQSFKGDVKWNFEKFLIDENGSVVARFRSAVKPMAKEITTLI